MRANPSIAIYRRLREQPMWRLLAAQNAPTILGILAFHLSGDGTGMPGSLLHPRIERDLEDLRARGDDMPQTAQVYVATWLREGWLERRLPPGAAEEIYDLSAAAVAAIRFADGLEQPKSAATESRLAIVIAALTSLAADTDTDAARKIARLEAEKARIESEIESIRAGSVRVLPAAAAAERVREVINLADELASDFRRVREEFEGLNQRLRASVMDPDGNRGSVLEQVFSGIDVIADSEAGRTFNAFWRLLTDDREATAMSDAIESLASKDFVQRLPQRERLFLLRLTDVLLRQGTSVHDVLQSFARNLKQFVQSREYLEQRRLVQLLREAQAAAVAVKDEARPTSDIADLALTSIRANSLSRWVFHDPSLQAVPGGMQLGAPAAIDLETIGALVAQSEIDFRSLKANVMAVLEEHSQASIGQVLCRFPATQGLGSVVGLIALGSRHGVTVPSEEMVVWTGNDGVSRRARIPMIHFVKEKADDLVRS